MENLSTMMISVAYTVGGGICHLHPFFHLLMTSCYYLSQGNAVVASGHLSETARSSQGPRNSTKFVVHCGSKARKFPNATFQKSPRMDLREDLLGRRVLVDRGSHLELVQDHEFNSPSAAASIFLGSNVSGLREWRDDQGNPLRCDNEGDAAQIPSRRNPLQEFEHQVPSLPRTTEAEGRILTRRGQNIFRAKQMHYWNGRCPLTNIGQEEMLTASHIRPWRRCETDDQRLDVYNGILLSPNWDKGLDTGLITFDEDGWPLFSDSLRDEKARAALALVWLRKPIPLTEHHQRYLAYHREHIFERT